MASNDPERSKPIIRRLPLAELALILIGAIVALGLEDWADERQEAENAVALLRLVNSELASNQSRIETEIPYHRSMLEPMAESLRSFGEGNDFSLPEGWQGTRPIALTKTAFRLAVSSNLLARLDPAVALEIASVYELMERSEVDEANTSLATLQTDFKDGDRYLRLLSYAIKEEVRRADLLLPKLASASELLDAELSRL
ncbi:MAG: hypothetical protein AAF578_02725 [Pseudomonadota bacterium]